MFLLPQRTPKRAIFDTGVPEYQNGEENGGTTHVTLEKKIMGLRELYRKHN